MKNCYTSLLKKIFLSSIISLSVNSASAQWVTYGPLMSNNHPTNFIATDGNYVYAANGDSGMYVSNNNGHTWVQSNNGITSMNALRVLVDGSKVFCVTFHGVYVSYNHGSSWVRTDSGMVASGTYHTDIIKIGSDYYSSTWNDFNGMYKSTDGAVSWFPIHTGLPSIPHCNALTSNSTNIFCAGAGYANVYTTINGGGLWTLVNNGLPTSAYVNTLTTIGNNLFAGTSSGGVYMSADNGANWSAVNNGLNGLGIPRVYSFYSNLFTGTSGGGLFLSIDNGSNWDSIGLGNETMLSLAVNDSFIFAGTDNGDVWQIPRQGIISSVQENKEMADDYVLLYPNPATDYLHVFSSGQSAVIIYNSLGQQIKYLPASEMNSGFATTINISAYPSGIYFIQMKTGNEFKLEKFVVLH